MLRYVNFRPVELESPVVRRRPSASPTAEYAGAGRTDMVAFFEWLHKKGVRTIIKVVVDDRKCTPHSDEAVEAALGKFDIEILDWRKVDMDPRAMWRGCRESNLRQVHYWWSGNNAILRACSEPDGLVKLQRLRRICLHQAQVRDTPAPRIHETGNTNILSIITREALIPPCERNRTSRSFEHGCRFSVLTLRTRFKWTMPNRPTPEGQGQEGGLPPRTRMAEVRSTHIGGSPSWTHLLTVFPGSEIRQELSRTT